jgi:glutaredoxin-like protein
MTIERITMHGTTWCPDCMRSKQVFAKLKISYDWIDIEQDKDSVAYITKINGGKKRVPTIVFPDNSVLVEPSNAELEKKLKSL